MLTKWFFDSSCRSNKFMTFFYKKNSLHFFDCSHSSTSNFDLVSGWCSRLQLVCLSVIRNDACRTSHSAERMFTLAAQRIILDVDSSQKTVPAGSSARLVQT